MTDITSQNLTELIKNIDQNAAAFILQGFLDYLKN